MPRPKLRRRICFFPNITYYKPQGVSMRLLKVVELTLEEVEALRLKNVEGLNQTKCAKQTKTSQSTFQRILNLAQKKVSKALINGMAIQINNKENPYDFSE